MRGRLRFGTLRRAADFVVLALFLGLAALSYDRLLSGFGELAHSPDGAQFTGFYRPGENPWSGALVPAPDDGRFARLAPAARSYR